MKRREFLASSAATAGLISLGGFSARKAQAQAALPNWVSSLPLWQWSEIPNTALSSIEPTPTPIGNSGPRSKIETWNGATLRRSGSIYMLGAAGGHADYAGNEVNALQLNTATPTWQQLRGPTPNASIIDSAQFYLDNRPADTHTYYATQFIESMNRMVVMSSPGLGGIGASPPAGWPFTGDKRIFSFSMASGDWDPPDFFALYPGGGDFTACFCVKHQATDDVYYSRNFGGSAWYRFSPSSNTWTQLSGVFRGPWYCASAMDPTRNRILTAGGVLPNSLAPDILNLNGSSTKPTFGGLGASALSVDGYPGALYDEVNDTFLVIYNSGASIAVRRVNAGTLSVDAPPLTGTAPTARINGIQNSAQYVPELGGFVIANRYAGNVYFVRTASAGVGVAVPDTTPPPAPVLQVK